MKIGDVVKLKSNSILMTVVRLIGDDHDEEGSGNFFKSMDRRFEMQGFNFGDPTCIWFEGNTMQQAVYKTKDLEIVPLSDNNSINTIIDSEVVALSTIDYDHVLDLDELDSDLGEIDFEIKDTEFELDDLDFNLDDLDLNFDEIDLDQPNELDFDLGLEDDDLNLEEFEIEDLNTENFNLDFETDFSQESDEIMLDFDL
jgi:hypothetical protein